MMGEGPRKEWSVSTRSNRRPGGRARWTRDFKRSCERRRGQSIGFFFFFQAEDGIRDYKVTGVQTCALPICPFRKNGDEVLAIVGRGGEVGEGSDAVRGFCGRRRDRLGVAVRAGENLLRGGRSEERRVGEECRSRWSPDH